MALLLVARTGVAELHYVDEEQKIVGEPLDVFLTQVSYIQFYHWKFSLFGTMRNL